PAKFLAPRDDEAGGTWLGLTPAGLFVAVTNRFGVERDPRRRSRGALVVEALTAPDAKTLHQRLSSLDPPQYNAFHLLYADRREAFVTWSNGTTRTQQVLEPGVHIVTERSLGGDDRARTELIRRLYAKLDAPPTRESLVELLSQHDEQNPVGATCVHVPSFGYGTRSSFILRMAETWEQSDAAWTEGSPCRNPVVDGAEALRVLTA
ncbi:MAG TPA: NRDE family protein, partial [Gemmatimonadaceae bacterium]|nr:NRDE family protein [Gemmatimonadaceae bacterium]